MLYVLNTYIGNYKTRENGTDQEVTLLTHNARTNTFAKTVSYSEEFCRYSPSLKKRHCIVEGIFN